MESEPTNTIQEMKDTVNGVLDKYTFIEAYLAKPNIKTGKPMPIFIKMMSTIIYLRQRLEFLVEPDESFYEYVECNDYEPFKNLDICEIHKILITFVTFLCGYVSNKVDEEENKEKIITTIRSYYYKNKDFSVLG